MRYCYKEKYIIFLGKYKVIFCDKVFLFLKKIYYYIFRG